MGAISLDTVVRRGGDHVETRMGAQTVMMSISQGKYYALEDTGQRIWELMNQPVAVCAIVDLLTREFDVERTRCEAHVLAFLEELRENGLVAEDAA